MFESPKTTAHSDIPFRKTLIQWDVTPISTMLFAIIQPPMSQGQGDGKVKLHRMNLVAAGSPLTDMGFV